MSQHETVVWRVDYSIGDDWVKGPTFGACEGAMEWIKRGGFENTDLRTRIVRISEVEWAP